MDTTKNTNLKFLNEYNAESDLKGQGSFITPTDAFFRRGRAPPPKISLESYKLNISASADEKINLNFKELAQLPSKNIIFTMECAGNGRQGITPNVSGEPWGYGAVSTAQWKGVALSTLLHRVGIKPSTVEILFEGADNNHNIGEGKTIHFARSLPLTKALDADVLVAYEMNGKPLPLEHGFPVRLVVPGWYGMASVKWLTQIKQIDYKYEGFYQKERYVMKTKENQYPVTAIKLRSVITSLNDGNKIKAGKNLLRGFAWSGENEIKAVDISTDNGSSWNSAKLLGHSQKYIWVPWEYIWNAKAGQSTIMSMAYDSKGNSQPEKVLWNELGYSNNAIQKINLTVE